MRPAIVHLALNLPSKWEKISKNEGGLRMHKPEEDRAA